MALERSRLELDLAHALANGQMHLAYQPYVDLRDGRVSGAEALLRWRHPTRGELPPAAFIPLAEATGMILPLGRWALRAAHGAGAGLARRASASRSTSRRCSSTSRASSPRSTPRSRDDRLPAPGGSSSRSPRPC